MNENVVPIIRSETVRTEACSACGHEHTDESLAFICVGCACRHYPFGYDAEHNRWGDCPECDEPWPCEVVGVVTFDPHPDDIYDTFTPHPIISRIYPGWGDTHDLLRDETCHCHPTIELTRNADGAIAGIGFHHNTP